MLSEGKGTAAADAVKMYVVTFEDIVKQLCWCECEVCEANWHDKMQAKGIPQGSTHFYRARQGEEDESWGVLGEIPK